MQASTALTAAFTPFTLANFTQSIMVNLTNVNGTNQNPTGASRPLCFAALNPARCEVCTTTVRLEAQKALGMLSISLDSTTVFGDPLDATLTVLFLRHPSRHTAWVDVEHGWEGQSMSDSACCRLTPA